MSRIAGVGQVGMNMRREDGIAMIVALMAMLLMSALGAALVMTTTSETIIAGNFSRGQEGLYAADAAFERAMDDLLTVPDWNKLLDGTTQSAFIDGGPSGDRVLRSEEHTSELQSQFHLVCRLLLEKKKLDLRKTLLMASSVRLKPLNCSRLPCVYAQETLTFLLTQKKTCVKNYVQKE